MEDDNYCSVKFETDAIKERMMDVPQNRINDTVPINVIGLPPDYSERCCLAIKPAQNGNFTFTQIFQSVFFCMFDPSPSRITIHRHSNYLT